MPWDPFPVPALACPIRPLCPVRSLRSQAHVEFHDAFIEKMARKHRAKPKPRGAAETMNKLRMDTGRSGATLWKGSRTKCFRLNYDGVRPRDPWSGQRCRIQEQFLEKNGGDDVRLTDLDSQIRI
eukprot:s1914_g3.t1